MNKGDWNSKDVVDFYINNRHSYSELYESEKYFLTPKFIQKIDSVLDVGCASGGFFKIFSEFNNNVTYHGIDVSIDSIEYAKAELKDDRRAVFTHYDGVSPFSFANNSFDLTFSSGVMHLIDNYAFVLREMIRVSRKYLLVDFRLTNEATYCGKFSLQFTDSLDNLNNVCNYHVLNVQEALSLFTTHSEVSKVSLFGYKGKASHMAEGVKEPYMVFFLVEKGKRETADASSVKIIPLGNDMINLLN